MSMAELRQHIDRLNPEERVALKYYLVENFPNDELITSASFDEGMARMDDGRKISWDQVKPMLEQQ